MRGSSKYIKSTKYVEGPLESAALCRHEGKKLYLGEEAIYLLHKKLGNSKPGEGGYRRGFYHPISYTLKKNECN